VITGLILCALFLAAPVAWAAPDVQDQIASLLPPARDEFVIGISELTTDDLPAERGFIGSTFSLLLYEEIRSLEERELSLVEQEAFLELRREQALVDAGAELRAAVSARDDLLFAPNSGRPGRRPDPERLAPLEERLTEARRTFSLLSEYVPEANERIRRPITFLPGLEDGTLLPPARFAGTDEPVRADLETLTAANEVDLLLFGRAEEQAGYVIVDLYAYHRALDESVLLSSTIRLAEEVGLDAGPVAEEIAAALLGREWATLELVADHSDAAIRINGALAGLGSAVLRFTDPGRYDVTATLAGYAPVERMVELATGERLSIQLSFVERAGNRVTLRSSPPGADVYIESTWVGRTPIVYEFPGGSSVVQMRREGFLPSRFVVDETTPPIVSRALLNARIDWTEELREQRNEFYDALGYFVLSVPVTMILWGGYQNVLGTRASPDLSALPPSEDQRLVQLGNTLYWSAIGGLAINVGLFINVVLNLLDYVAVGEGAHNQ
jgi:hypothetical protein